MNPTELTIRDIQEIEESAIDQIKTAHKIYISASATLKKAEELLKARGEETAKERKERLFLEST